MKNRSILLLIVATNFYTTFAMAQGAKPPVIPSVSTASKPVATSSTSAPKWEYLVVSFGKTYFSDPTETPSLKTGGLSKVITYSPLGVVGAQEALSTQAQMDTLGRFGWELVSVVGAIGGEQQMVFRRNFDATRSAQEAAAIEDEGALIAKQRDEREAQNKALGQSAPRDLDSEESGKSRDELRSGEENRLATAIKASDLKILAMKMQSRSTAKEEEVSWRIDVDATESLLHDGTYRASQARTWANAAILNLARSAGLSPRYSFHKDPDSYFYGASLYAKGDSLPYSAGGVDIELNVIVTMDGKQWNLGKATYTGTWKPER